jgi:flagellar assembly protein FliH
MTIIKREIIKDKEGVLLPASGFEPTEEKDEEKIEETPGFSPQVRALTIIDKAKKRAGQIIAKSQSEAQEMINDAQNEVEEIKAKANKEGLEKGRQEGLYKANKHIEEAFKTLNEAVKEKTKIVKSAEPEILKLSIKIAEQIIRSEVQLNQDICMKIIAEAVSKITDREKVIIRVNQGNLDQVKRNKDRLASLIDGVKNLSIVEDSSIESGGCVVETDLGFVDAKISTKLKAIEDALEKAYSEEKNEPQS